MRACRPYRPDQSAVVRAILPKLALSGFGPFCIKSFLIKPIGVDDRVIRSFWHGPPLDPYLLLCLGSFARRGYPVEVFTYERNHGFPSWIVARDAGDILPTETVMVYRNGPGAGSPALHANLFRLLLLDRFGGWWVDTDAALLRAELPATPFYFVMEESDYTNSIMKFPPAHPLLAEAARLTREAGDDVPWTTTGPTLLTALIGRYELQAWAASSEQGCPFIYKDVPAFFDPARAEEMAARASSSSFMHLCCEMWRRIGIPMDLGPPIGSFLDVQFRGSGLDIHFPARIDLPSSRCGLPTQRRRSSLKQAWKQPGPTSSRPRRPRRLTSNPIA
jgi:hypothetical protein